MARPRAVTDEAILAAARRCFLERGASISAVEIAKELGVTHTTVFNRFRTKDALMIAALGPPEVLPWAEAVGAGPDDRPVREQLEEIGRRISDYFAHILPGLAMLNAAGLGPKEIFRGRAEPTPVQAFRALTGWLKRARRRGLIAPVDADALASTIIGALHSYAFNELLTGLPPPVSRKDFTARFFHLLWSGIAPTTHNKEKKS
jgi:AcrR family transcriptional regulator